MSHSRCLAYESLTISEFRHECRKAFALQIDACCSADKELAFDRQLDLWAAAKAASKE